MKILYCIPSLEHGGAERQLSYLASELASIGHEVHVASLRGGPNLYRLKSAGVNWHRVGKSSNRDPRIFFRLIALMRKLRPDVEEIGKARSSSITRLASAPEKIALFAGRLDANKNVENLIIALARVADEMAFIGFICGDGPQRPSLERLARRVGVAPANLYRLRFKLVGFDDTRRRVCLIKQGRRLSERRDGGDGLRLPVGCDTAASHACNLLTAERNLH